MAKPVWIDCDPGLDDAIALMVLASRTDRFQLQGITTVAGNQTADKTFLNARRIAAYLSLDILVAKGAEKPLRRSPLTAGDFHGEDGLAGMRVGASPLPGDPRSASALLEDFLLSLNQPAVLFATGPLTNLAELFQKKPDLKKRVDHITIMGGSLCGGNVTPYAEFNFCADPDAANLVLNMGVPIRLIGLDVTQKAYLTDCDFQKFSSLETRYGDMVADLTAFYAPACRADGLPGTPIHDAAAVLFELNPELFPIAEPLHLDVVTEGDHMGECVISPHKAPNVLFAKTVDRFKFVETLLACCSR